MKTIRIILLLALLLESGATYARKSKKETPQAVEQTAPEEVTPLSEDYTTEVLLRMSALYNRGVDEKLYLQSDKPYYSAGENIWFKGYLRSAITHTSIEHSNYIYVELVSREDELVSRVKVKRDSTGFNGYITLDPKMSEGDYTLRAYTRWMLNEGDEGIFNKAIRIISPIPESEESTLSASSNRRSNSTATKSTNDTPANREYTVQFFPEGGALLPDMMQMVAFKAVGEDGLSIEVEGVICDSTGESIREIKSTHKGMGVASIYAEQGESYYAVVYSEDGAERRFELPEVERSGAVISTTLSGGKLFFQVRSTDAELIEGAHIVIHSRGQIISTLEADSSRGVWAIPQSDLLDGVSVITLISKGGDALSERLVFYRSTDVPSVTIESDELNYSGRERAEVSIQVLDSAGEPARGEFAVAVSDDSSIRFNSASESMLSYLLLSSDLQGYIEDSGAYFDGSLSNPDYSLDLLMRTQGWRRFDLSEVLRGRISDVKYKYESEVEISGSVKGFFGNDARRPSLQLFSLNPPMLEIFELDETSQFRLLGLDMPDSTRFMIKATGRSGGNMMTVNVDQPIYATPKSTLFKRVSQGADEEYDLQAFVNQSKEKFYYEGGMNIIDIDAVSVSTKRQVTPSVGGSFYTRATGREELDALSGMLLPYIIQGFPSMSVTTDGVSYQNNEEYARFVVNGMDMDYFEVEQYTADDIESIAFFSPSQAIEFYDSDGGIFVVDLRADYVSKSGSSPNVACISPLGYQRSMTLYQPSYDDPALKRTLPPDYRTTIFWSGELQPDEHGFIVFELFTADKATSYTITVEGITDSGEICKGASSMMRTLQ